MSNMTLSTPSPFIASCDAMNKPSKTLTENGAPCLADAGDACVTLFFKTARDLSSEALEELFAAAVAESSDKPELIADLFVLAFHTRATRGMGKGEKDLAYSLLLLLAAPHPRGFGVEAVVATLPLLATYGYYKDYLAILERKPPEPIAERCLSIMAEALKADEAELALAASEQRTPKLSLCGKWAPREGGKADKATGAVKALAKALYGDANASRVERKYRKLVVSLNAALNTTEVLMAANRWSEIQFSAVASLCLERHRKAFLNEMIKGGPLTAVEEETGNRHPYNPDRVAARAALKEAIVSKKGVQGKQLMPHQIAAKFMHGSRPSSLETEVLATMWKTMREGVVEVMAAAAAERAAEIAKMADSAAEAPAPTPKHVDLGTLVPLVDVSGSMSGQPMEVAIALGILVSELTLPAFRDRILTFETSPSWVDLSSCSSIAEKVWRVQSAGWGGSTDFAAACERILSAAETAKLKPDQIPDLIVFSDMQFDQAGVRGYAWETHLERLQRRFAEVGVAVCGEPYAAPRVIFWNLRGSGIGCPASADTPNTQLLSGFSPALLKLVLSGADVVGDEEVEQPDGTIKMVKSGPTPKQTLRKALDDEAFDAVRLKLSELKEGPLKDYTFVKPSKDADGFELV